MTEQEAIKYLIMPVATSTDPGKEYMKQREAYEMAKAALRKNTDKNIMERRNKNVGRTRYEIYWIRLCISNE